MINLVDAAVSEITMLPPTRGVSVDPNKDAYCTS